MKESGALLDSRSLPELRSSFCARGLSLTPMKNFGTIADEREVNPRHNTEMSPRHNTKSRRTSEIQNSIRTTSKVTGNIAILNQIRPTKLKLSTTNHEKPFA